MGCVSTGMGDRFSALFVSLMALWLMLVGQNPFWPIIFTNILYLLQTKGDSTEDYVEKTRSLEGGVIKCKTN